MQFSMKSLISGLTYGRLFGLILALALFTAGTATAGEISRALFTTGIDDHEPVAIVDSIDSKTSNSISFLPKSTTCQGKR
jgi:uncharacterized membrane protein